MIVSIRTDKPEAEIGLFNGNKKIDYIVWTAHRQLAETIHQKIETLLKEHNKQWSDISGVVCYKGPGSFTGLRIGLTVANTLAYSLKVPITGETGENWLKHAMYQLEQGANETIAVPDYGRDPHITKAKK